MTTEPLKRDRALDAFVPTRRSLLSRLRNLDDKVSWQDFFETYWKLIYSTATKAGLSDADAQDVVMETVRTVVRVIGRFKYDPSAGAFKGWLLKIARWRILDHLRHRRSVDYPEPGSVPADHPVALGLARPQHGSADQVDDGSILGGQRRHLLQSGRVPL